MFVWAFALALALADGPICVYIELGLMYVHIYTVIPLTGVEPKRLSHDPWTLGSLGPRYSWTLRPVEPWSNGSLCREGACLRGSSSVQNKKKDKRAAFEWSAVSGTAFLQKADLARERN